MTETSIYAVWIDSEEAKIFQFSNEKMERSQLRASHADHHTHTTDAVDRVRRDHTFFGQVLQGMPAIERLLILGPGVAKHHFQNFLLEQHPLIGKKIVGCENADHPTDGQIAATARRVFQIGEPTGLSHR